MSHPRRTPTLSPHVPHWHIGTRAAASRYTARPSAAQRHARRESQCSRVLFDRRLSSRSRAMLMVGGCLSPFACPQRPAHAEPHLSRRCVGGAPRGLLRKRLERGDATRGTLPAFCPARAKRDATRARARSLIDRPRRRGGGASVRPEYAPVRHDRRVRGTRRSR